MADHTRSLAGRIVRAATTIEPGEARATFLSFTCILVLMAAYYILRPVRDAMSSDWSDAELSALFTGTFVFTLVAVVVYGLACSRVRFRWLAPGVYAFFAASFLLFYVVTRDVPDADWARKAFFVWVSVFGLFHVSVFWSYMADLFSRDQAPRLFGFIAAGASIGALAGSSVAVSLVQALGPMNLTLIAAVMLIVPMIILGLLHRVGAGEAAAVPDRPATASAPPPVPRTTPVPPSSPPAPARPASGNAPIGGNPFAGFTLFLRNPYLLGIAAFILLYTAISTFVYFELKNLLEPVDEAIRGQIWGGIDLSVNILAIGTAMFATGRLSLRFGLVATLALIPVLIVAGLVILALAPVIWVVVILQVVRRAGNYAVTRPGREMLFTVVDRETRFKAKSVIDVVVYRGGDAATAWAFTGLTEGLGLALGAVAGVGAVLAAFWAALGGLLGRAYHRRGRGPGGPAPPA